MSERGAHRKVRHRKTKVGGERSPPLDKVSSLAYSRNVHAIIFNALVFWLIVLGQSRAQTPWISTAHEALPSRLGLPEILRFEAGAQVVTADDWARRREEMKSMLLHYQYGRMPDAPDRVTAKRIKRVTRDDGKGREEWLNLIIGSKRQLEMRMVLYLPHDGPGPFPVIIREEGTLGGTRQVPLFLENGYAFVEYARHDLDPDKKGVVGPAQAAFPNHDWATLAVWAWGGMRVVDYLETRKEIDHARIGITGHSRGGKMALLAGALDERFALVVPNGSGAGGAGASRILGPGAESVGMNDKPHWYHERLQWFGGREDRLPFDQHFLKALVAPRALLCTESTDDLFANPHGTQRTSRAAREIYTFLGVDPRRNGLHFRRGEHASNDADWEALLEFAQWHFFGRPPADPEKFWQFPDHERPPTVAPAASELRWVRVDDPGNPPDTDHFGAGAFGSVDRPFRIAHRKVNHQEYAAFLNAVASQTDPHALYHASMKIERQGVLGAYTYRIRDEGARHRPITHVGWTDALRYCNWLHHGKPVGPQDQSTTEDGAYKMSEISPRAVRQAGAKFFLPTIDEWYKAAYYDPSSASYRLFPLPDQPYGNHGWKHFNRSHYGMLETEDALWEWTESSVGRSFRGIRSDSWFQGNNRQAAGHFYSNPDIELAITGFRVAAR